MKKFLYLLLLLPLAFAATSCDDDDDKVPEVDITATVTNGYVDGNTIYVVQGETLGMEISMVNHTNKDGQIGAVSMQIDYYPYARAIVAPYKFDINTATMPVGRHLLQAEMPVFVVDYPICYGYFDCIICVVASKDDIPAGLIPQPINGLVKEKD